MATTAAEMTIFTEDHMETLVSEADVDQVIEEQREYEPQEHEAFRDDIGDHWYFDGFRWIVVDRADNSEISSHSGNNWRVIVENNGPLVYKGMAEDKPWLG
jgi:hypothetical protein